MNERLVSKICFISLKGSFLSTFRKFALRGFKSFYSPVIGRFLNEDTYYGDGLNLYAYCHNNPLTYVDPTGHWCEKKQQETVQKYKDKGYSDQDAETMANYERLREEQGVDAAEKYLQEQVRGNESGSKTKLNYVTSNGLVLETTPNKTTTVLETYKSDTGSILDELGNVKSLDFGPRDGGFNLLNTPDELYVSPNQFWNEYNKPWLDNAIARDDIFKIATEPTWDNLTRINMFTGKTELTGFGREYTYLKKHGYSFDAVTKTMFK